MEGRFFLGCPFIQHLSLSMWVPDSVLSHFTSSSPRSPLLPQFLGSSFPNLSLDLFFFFSLVLENLFFFFFFQLMISAIIYSAAGCFVVKDFSYCLKCRLYFKFFFLFTASPAVYGISQAKGQIKAAAASQHHSHGNGWSEPHLWPSCGNPTSFTH